MLTDFFVLVYILSVEKYFIIYCSRTKLVLVCPFLCIVICFGKIGGSALNSLDVKLVLWLRLVANLLKRLLSERIAWVIERSGHNSGWKLFLFFVCFVCLFVFCLFCLFVCLFYDFTNDYRDSNFLVWSFGRLNCGMTSTATGIMSSTLQLKKHLSQYIYTHEAFDIFDCSGI